MRLISTIILILIAVACFAQLNTQKDVYSRCDSLRGSLRLERTCFDVGYYDLDVVVDPENQYIKGSNTIVFKAVEASNKIQIEFQSILSTQCISNARYPVGLNEHIEMTDPSVTEEDFTIYKILFEKYKKNLAKNFHLKGWDSGLNDPLLKTSPGDWSYIEK